MHVSRPNQTIRGDSFHPTRMTRGPSSCSKLNGLSERRRAMGWRTLQEPVETGAASIRTPDYAAPLYAWRLWEVHSAGSSSRLRSLYRDCIWPVGAPVVARCEAHRFRL